MDHKKLLRLYREEGLAVRRRRGRKRATGTRAPVALPQGPNQRWSLDFVRSEEHTSELQSLMRISYAVFCLKKKKKTCDDTVYQTEHFDKNRQSKESKHIMI